MIDLNSRVTEELFSILSQHANKLTKLSLNYFKSSGNQDNFDAGSLVNFIKKCSNLKALTLNNMFRTPYETRHLLANIFKEVIQANASTLTHFDMQGFSMSTDEISGE